MNGEIIQCPKCNEYSKLTKMGSGGFAGGAEREPYFCAYCGHKCGEWRTQGTWHTAKTTIEKLTK